jgi:nucleotide-binding universal stress UspA family protein
LSCSYKEREEQKRLRWQEKTMNILIAVDSSAPSEAAVEEVAFRPWPAGSRFCVLSVAETAYFTEAAAYLIETATEAAQTVTARAAQLLAAHGLDSNAAVLHGHPKSEIVEYADGWRADLVVVGSHGHGGLTRFLLGSVAKAVVRSASCSVEVVRNLPFRKVGLTRGAMKVLLATDGSEYSTAAARSIVERPWPEKSEVRVLGVEEVLPPPVVEPWYGNPGLADKLRAEARKLAEHAVAEGQQLVSASGRRVTTAVIRGNPKSTIVEEAARWGADLVVVGSHGRHGVERLLLGSVSEAVAVHAQCSVEVVRQRA